MTRFCYWSISSHTTHGAATAPNWDSPGAPQGESHNMYCVNRGPLGVHKDVLGAKEANNACKRLELLNWSAESTCTN